MSAAWVPVLLAVVIVFGVIGGTVLQMVLKELLPLLRSMAEERRRGDVAPGTDTAERLAALEQRLALLEADQRELEEQGEFLQKLLSERQEEAVGPQPRE